MPSSSCWTTIFPNDDLTLLRGVRAFVARPPGAAASGMAALDPWRFPGNWYALFSPAEAGTLKRDQPSFNRGLFSLQAEISSCMAGMVIVTDIPF